MRDIFKYGRVIEIIFKDIPFGFSRPDDIAVGLYDSEVIDLLSGKGSIYHKASSVEFACIYANILLIARVGMGGSDSGFVGT